MSETPAQNLEAHQRRFRPYPEYKDSGVEWLGEIPGHWGMTPLKRIASIRYGLGEPPRQLTDGLPFIRATNVVKGRIVDHEMQFVDPKEVPWNRNPVLRADDIIVVRSGAYTGDSARIPAEYEGAIAGYDMVVRSRRDWARFLAWTLLSRYVLESQVELESMRAAQPHLNAEELGSVLLLLPPDSEQRAIAAFLDRETARIDALVAKKERLCELLQEKRTALITRAVTKGLDPNVPMKDSGVEWLGEIPAHWDAARMWRVSSATSGGTPTKEEHGYWNGGIPWVSPKDMKRRFIDSSEDTITERALTETAIKLIAPPVVLIVVRGMILAHTFPVAITTVPVTINQDMKALSFRHGVEPPFAVWLFEGVGKGILGAVVEEAAHGTRVIRMDRWRMVVASIPPKGEQRAITAFLDCETAKLDALVAKVRDAIDRLKELRTALISAAVTGKIDVREKVA